MMRTANPTLNDRVFREAAIGADSEVMTIEGTVNKTFFALAITIAAAYLAWINPAVAAFAIPAVIAGLILALVVVFKAAWAPVLTPIYAAVEGVFMGAISQRFELQYPGIVNQAVMLTFGVMICMLLAYRSGLIPVTNKLRMGIFAATGAIALLYLVSFLFSMFGGGGFGFLHSSSPLSIGISIVVILVAAFNLILDFDLIDRAAESGSAPKYMEWYGAFALLVTLVWLYIEILRLLAKLKDR